jgi:hypothetical protein
MLCGLGGSSGFAIAYFLASRHSGEGRNPCFVLAMDSGLRRNDDTVWSEQIWRSYRVAAYNRT